MKYYNRLLPAVALCSISSIELGTIVETQGKLCMNNDPELIF